MGTGGLNLVQDRQSLPGRILTIAGASFCCCATLQPLLTWPGIQQSGHTASKQEA